MSINYEVAIKLEEIRARANHANIPPQVLNDISYLLGFAEMAIVLTESKKEE